MTDDGTLVFKDVGSSLAQGMKASAMTDPNVKLAELEELKQRVAHLERDLSDDATLKPWTPPDYYAVYHVLAGMVLGFIAASASLVFNVVGAAMVGKHPLELIRVYLTFPLGESALTLSSGFSLAAGCCLYLGTGMVGGIPFHIVLSRYFDDASFAKRFMVASLLGIGVWLINFYAFLSWAQPMLIGGNWIVEQVPFVVAMLTHLIFAWTMLLVDHWGRFVPHGSMTQEVRN